MRERRCWTHPGPVGGGGRWEAAVPTSLETGGYLLYSVRGEVEQRDWGAESLREGGQIIRASSTALTYGGGIYVTRSLVTGQGRPQLSSLDITCDWGNLLCSVGGR